MMDDEMKNDYFDEPMEDNSFDSIFDKEELKDLYNRRNTKQEHFKAYVKKEDHYKDIYTSGITFLVVSILGIILLILNILGVLTIFQGLIPFVIMGALFLSFLLIGIISLGKSTVIKGQIGEEVKTTAMIQDWLRTNLTKEELLAQTNGTYDTGEKYLQMMDYMKEQVTHHFGELEDNYLDYVVEEFYEEQL